MQDMYLSLVVLGLADSIAKDMGCLGAEVRGIEDGLDFRDHEVNSCLA
jgi:hypothetical protein